MAAPWALSQPLKCSSDSVDQLVWELDMADPGTLDVRGLGVRYGGKVGVEFGPDFLPDGLTHSNAGKISTAFPPNP